MLASHMTDPTPIDAGRLNRFLDEYTVEILKKYFDSGEYTGGRFERFAGGGDRAESADRFTAEDIIAASFLGARFPGRASLEILEDRADEFSALLSQIPVDVDLWTAPDDAVGPESPAGQLWTAVAALPGSSAMAAGKLLARKRPRFIPVLDRVLKASLERRDEADWWLALRAVLSSKATLVGAITEIREQSGLEDISILRIMHVCIWMREFGRPESASDADS